MAKNTTMGRVSVFALALAAALGTRSALAQGPAIVHFAGFALSGNFAQSAESFPYTSALIQNSDKNALMDINRALVDKIRTQTFDNAFITTDLGDFKKGDALALAFVLTWENVSKEPFEDFTKVAINLQADAILFDFATKQIVSAYPFGVEYIDSVKGPSSPQRELNDVRGLYDVQAGNFLDAFIVALHRIQPKTSFGGRLQITSTSISPAAAQQLAQYRIDSNQAQELLENAFERYLTHNTGVPILPHANNQAIGGVMAARFVNGDVFNFVIPKPDYRIQLTLNNLRRVEVSRTAAETAFAYASYLDVTIDQPLSGTQFLAASFKYPVVKVISNTGIPDDASALQESLLSISDQITQQFNRPSKKWSDQWLVKETESGQLARMPDLLQRCR